MDTPCPNPVGAFRGEERRRGYRRVAHGLFLPQVTEGAAAARRRDLHAWRLTLPADAVYTHLTAAWLLDLWLPKLPDAVPVFAAVRGDVTRPQRMGMVVSRLRSTSRPSERHGLPVDAVPEVLLRCARDLGVLDLAPMICRALREGLTTADEVASVGTGRPGVRRLRAALQYADPRHESPWEVRMAIFHQLAGVPVEPQYEVRTSDGRPVGRADLRISGTNLLQEYDGHDHDRPDVRVNDLRRMRRFAETPYVRRGYVADDLLNHDVLVLQEIDRALGRRFQASRLQPWRRMVAESTYSERGMARFQSRWVHLTGVADWWKTA